MNSENIAKVQIYFYHKFNCSLKKKKKKITFNKLCIFNLLQYILFKVANFYLDFMSVIYCQILLCKSNFSHKKIIQINHNFSYIINIQCEFQFIMFLLFACHICNDAFFGWLLEMCSLTKKTDFFRFHLPIMKPHQNFL